MDADVKKTIKDLLEGIDEFDSKYMTYKSKTHREFLEKTLNYIKHKEQECENLNSDNRYFVNQIIALETLTDEYEQAFNEIEKYCKKCNLKVDFTTCDILDIIDTVKDCK